MPVAEVQIGHQRESLAGTLHVAGCPAVVFVHGSGPADRTTPAVERIVRLMLAQGLTVFAYDKPGCGGSSGDWREQTLHDRADEAIAVATYLRSHSPVDGAPIALVGGSQGGWVSIIAAARSPEIAAVVTLSGAGVSVGEQELYRVEHDLSSSNFAAAEVAEARAFLERRIKRMAAGENIGSIHRDEQEFNSRSWRVAVGGESLDELAFDARIYGYDPGFDIEAVTCPLLGVWGSADTIVPVRKSIDRYLRHMTRAHPLSTLLIIPNADHRLMIDSAAQSGPGSQVWPVVAGWLHLACRS